MRRTLAEHDSLALLHDHGIPVVAETVVATPADAARAATTVGFPVVVKAAGDRIAHKTERGLVRLGLRSAPEVEAAATQVLGATGPEDGAVALVVAPMIRGARELIAGLHRDDQFGPCVMVGIGGVLAEALADVAIRLAPIDTHDAHDMLDDLRGGALLGPFRGEPAVDRDRVAAVLLALSDLATARPDLIAVDVNPLVIVNGAPVAVDALVELDS
jgi:acetate---CoA ligase (ADP-forming) subunit beta